MKQKQIKNFIPEIILQERLRVQEDQDETLQKFSRMVTFVF
jgi:hypothetical protein